MPREACRNPSDDRILRMASEGWSPVEIADAIGSSPEHVKRIVGHAKKSRRRINKRATTNPGPQP